MTVLYRQVCIMFDEGADKYLVPAGNRSSFVICEMLVKHYSTSRYIFNATQSYVERTQLIPNSSSS